MAAENNIQANPIKNEDADENTSDVEIKSLIWYRVECFRVCLFYFLSFVSLGSLLITCFWFPRVKIFIIGRKCHRGDATHALIRDMDNNWNIIKIRTKRLESPSSFHNINLNDQDESARLIIEDNDFTYLIFRHARYVMGENGEVVRKQTAFDIGYICEQIYEISLREDSENPVDSLKIYGPNLIDVPVKSYWTLFIEEVIDPFYLFQLFSIVIWLLVNYYYYAGAVFIISVVSITLSLYQTRKNMVQLKEMITYSCCVNVHRGTVTHTNTPCTELYPGDVIEIPCSCFTMPCDCVLLSGNAIVNESMLTGESVPVFKTPLPHNNEEMYSVYTHKRHTLFNGTEVIQTRNSPNAKVLAFVVRTGYSTSKGELVRSIIYPKPTHLRFSRQSFKFLIFLIFLGIIGMTYTLIIQLIHDGAPFEIFLHMADLFTTAVPPSLPAAMTVGIIYALARLKKQKIFCISPQRINVGGKVKCVCFDKTGTLTEDGLDFWGVVPVVDGCFTDHVQDLRTLGVTQLTVAMSCCHSLTLLNGQLVGDPVDLNMFNATGCTFEEPQEETNRFDLLVPALVRSPTGTDQIETGILHQYPFSSELQRMSVLAKCLGEGQPGNLILYSKGSPEMISSLSLPHSLPDNFNKFMSIYTNMGLRVLALAYKNLDMPWHKVGRMTREEMETDLTFLGLLLMQNKLKPQTSAVIRELNRVDIRNVMVTGDNLLTALNVASDCEIIRPNCEVFIVSVHNDHSHSIVTMDNKIVFTPQNSDMFLRPNTNIHGNLLSILPKSEYYFAMDGTTFQLIREHASKYIVTALLLKCAVFARMSPTQKSIVVEDLQKLDYVVAMCGDGANDCGALKSADVGVSLSDSEASVASHFTSKVHDIRCIPIVIKEGRTALVTSFSIFKFMALYCIIEFMSVVLMYWFLSNLGDWQYLYIDLILVFSLALVMGYTKPFPRMAYRRPSANLVNAINLISCGVHMLLVIGFQISSFLLLITTEWYHPFTNSPVLNPFAGDPIVSSENTVVFTFSTFQYLIIAFVFSVGPPYRKPFFTNIYFLLCFLSLTCISLLFTIQPGHDLVVLHQIYDFMQLKFIYSWTFQLGLILLAGVHLLVSLIVEDFIIRTEWFRKVVHFFLCKRRQKNLYKRLLADWSRGAEQIRVAVTSLK